MSAEVLSKKQATLITLILVLVAAVFIVQSGILSPKPEAVKPVVRVGYLTSDLHHLAYFVAKNQSVGGGMSFFEEYGLNVTDAAAGGYAHGGAEMDAFAGGQVDIGYLGSPPAITKHLNAGVNTSIIAQVNEIGSGLVVSKDINRFLDLKGKTVAVPSHSSIQYFLLLMLAEREGVEIKDIQVIDVTPLANMKIKMEKGEISGFVAWEPFVSDAVISNIGKLLASSNDIWPHHICCVLVVSNSFAADHGDLVVKFLRAHMKATDWINNAKSKPNSNEYALLIDIAVHFTGRSREVVENALKLIDYKYEIDQTFISSFRVFTEKLIQYKIVPVKKLNQRGYGDIDSFISKYVNKAFLEEAKRK